MEGVGNLWTKIPLLAFGNYNRTKYIILFNFPILLVLSFLARNRRSTSLSHPLSISPRHRRPDTPLLPSPFSPSPTTLSNPAPSPLSQTQLGPDLLHLLSQPQSYHPSPPAVSRPASSSSSTSIARSPHYYQERYNIPELAKNYKVYALDLLGFGWSEKALIEYDAMIWRDQAVNFMKEIVQDPAVLVGNSLGGLTALVAAVRLPEQIVGLVLLNSAGQFGDPNAKPNESEESSLPKFFLKALKELFQRVVLSLLFWQAKQPARIESVLKSSILAIIAVTLGVTKGTHNW